MADRVFYYAASANRATTASTDYSAVGVSLSFTPNASKVHAVFWTAYLDNDNTFELFGARLRNTTDAATLGENFWEVPASTSEKQPMGGMAFYTSSASPSAVTFELQYKGNGAITVGIQEAAIFVLELGTNDVTASSDGLSSTTNSGYETKLTASWTPPASSDYLIVFSAEAYPSTSDSGPQLRCTDGTSFFGTCQPRDYGGTGAAGQQCYFHMARGLSLSTGQNWSIQYGVAFGTDAVNIQNARILALYLTDVPAYHWAEDRTEHSTSTSTFVDSSALVASTTNPVSMLVLACAVMGADDATSATLASNRLTKGGVSTVSNNSAQGVFVNNEQPWLYFTSYTATGATTTWATQYARLGGTGVARSDENVVFALELQSGQISLSLGNVTNSVAMGRAPVAIPHGLGASATAGRLAAPIPHSITASVALGRPSALAMPQGQTALAATGTPWLDPLPNSIQTTADPGRAPVAIPHSLTASVALGRPSALAMPRGIGLTVALGTPDTFVGASIFNVHGLPLTTGIGGLTVATIRSITASVALGTVVLALPRAATATVGIGTPTLQGGFLGPAAGLPAGSGPWRRWDLLPSIHETWQDSPQARRAAAERRRRAQQEAEWAAQWEAQLQAEADAAQAEMDQAEKFAEALRILTTEVKPLV